MQGGHFRECDETAAAEVGTFAAPEVGQSLRPAQRYKAVVSGYRLLGTQRAEAGDRGDVRHGGVIAQFAVTGERPEIRKAHQAGEAVRRDGADVPEEVELGDALQAGETRESVVGEGVIDEQ